MDSMKLAALVREIGAVAPQVAEEYTEQQAAFIARYNAQAKVLEQAIALARPALRSICNSIPMRDERGLVVIDGWQKNLEPGEWGRISEQPRVYLLSDGKLVKASRELGWNDEPVVGFIEIDTSDVVIEHDVTGVVTNIHTALAKQAGKRIASTTKAREEASKLCAILTLLDAPPAGNGSAVGEDIPF